MYNQSRNQAEVKGALYGTLLGDSTVTNRNEFSCEQISENLIKYKGAILENIAPDMKVYYHTRDRGSKQTINNKEYNRNISYVVQTNQHKYFENYRQALYNTGTKQVTKDILKYLTPEGLALWFMDDGYLDYKPSNNTRNLRICTDSFDELSIKNIMQYFNDTWHIQTKLYMHNAGYGRQPKPRVSFNPENAQKFIVLVHKYFLPEFYYKINLHYSEKTLNSKRCSKPYITAVEYMLQRTPSLNKEDDIV
jgi:hypothetical protein